MWLWSALSTHPKPVSPRSQPRLLEHNQLTLSPGLGPSCSLCLECPSEAHTPAQAAPPLGSFPAEPPAPAHSMNAEAQFHRVPGEAEFSLVSDKLPDSFLIRQTWRSQISILCRNTTVVRFRGRIRPDLFSEERV